MSGMRVNLETGEITHDALPAPPPTAEELRMARDQLLARSDWTQAADAPTDKTAWAVYRQALRDVPLQPGFPGSVIWPTEPE